MLGLPRQLGKASLKGVCLVTGICEVYVVGWFSGCLVAFYTSTVSSLCVYSVKQDFCVKLFRLNWTGEVFHCINMDQGCKYLNVIVLCC